MELKSGVLVAIEGIDGAGKTTQTLKLAERLRSVGLDVLTSKEPTDGPWGQRIRSSAQHGRMSPQDELNAFMEDRREHVQQLIAPALAAKQIVIVDRYYYSTAAYQGARGMDFQALIEQNEEFAPRPDLLIVLHVDAFVGVSRIRKRGDTANHFEREEELRRSAGIFDLLQGPHVLHVDGALPVAHITSKLARALRDGPLFKQLCLKPYKTECEPAYCTPQITGSCQLIQVGPICRSGDDELSHLSADAEIAAPR